MTAFTWTPTSSIGTWNDPTNWVPNGVPGAADSVTIPTFTDPATITGNVNDSVDDLALGGIQIAPGQAYTKLIISDASTLTVYDGIAPIASGYLAQVDLSTGSTLFFSLGGAGPGVVVNFADTIDNLLDLGGTSYIYPHTYGEPDAFSGTIAGFNSYNAVRLRSPYDPNDTWSYVQGAGGGVLTVMTTIPYFGYNPLDPTSPPTFTEPNAILHFSGVYNTSSFSIIDGDGQDQIVFVPQTFTGPTGGRATINGTSGDDTIIAYGASNLINGNGGSDTITTGSGGYNRVTQGSLGDGAHGTTTITLLGPGNVVAGGDENFTVSGGAGFTSVTLGNGNDNVSLGGTYNTISVGGGTNVIDAGGGYSNVSISGQIGVLPTVPNDTVIFTGQHNKLTVFLRAAQFISGGTITLSGGTGYGNYFLDGLGGIITTDGLYNTIAFSAPGAPLTVVRPGSGYDVVNFGTPANLVFYGPGAYTVYLAGTHNTVEGQAAPATVVGGSGNGQFLFNLESNAGTSLGAPVITDTYSVTTGGSYNKFALLDTNLNTIVAGSDHATVSITDPTLYYDPGQPPNVLNFVPSTITFAGSGNSLTAADGPVVATGGSGGSSYVLGKGTNNIATGGAYNQITTGAGIDTISAGSDHETVTLNGSNAAVMLQGAADKVFVNAGAAGTISGTGLADLHVYVTPDIGHEIINSILTDPRAIITLTDGAGGYTNPTQAFAALTPDGSGGASLAIGAGSLEFAGAPPSSLKAGMFVIA